jgi:hypothetical protein
LSKIPIRSYRDIGWILRLPSDRNSTVRSRTFLARYNASEEELSSSFDRILTPDIRFDIEEEKPLEEVLHRFIQLLSI